MTSHCSLIGLVLMLVPILGQAQSRPFDLAVSGNLVSILANNAPIQELANALSTETGIVFSLTGEKTTPITIEIVEEPLEKAIAKLSPNHLLVRDSEASDAQLIEVVLMMSEAGAAGGGGNTEFLPSGAPAEELVPDEQLMNPELAEQEPAPGAAPQPVDPNLETKELGTKTQNNTQ